VPDYWIRPFDREHHCDADAIRAAVPRPTDAIIVTSGKPVSSSFYGSLAAVTADGAAVTGATDITDSVAWARVRVDSGKSAFSSDQGGSG
jgi:hypothetical protein